MQDYRVLFHSGQDFSVSFVKRQANGGAHGIATAANFYASLSIWCKAPSFIGPLLVDDLTV
ncbi:conserved hypothetical protein [Ricinus communis]|uniref:Uncharacterized protein n=1 Tax=Ricinus communis TaxID=3988 RepID=B9RJ56_RICCO|nr:conserved hypothetical protein [Ricinus communis]